MPLLISIPFLFVIGVAFGYFVVLPPPLRFFQNFNSSGVQCPGPGRALLQISSRRSCWRWPGLPRCRSRILAATRVGSSRPSSCATTAATRARVRRDGGLPAGRRCDPGPGDRAAVHPLRADASSSRRSSRAATPNRERAEAALAARAAVPRPGGPPVGWPSRRRLPWPSPPGGPVPGSRSEGPQRPADAMAAKDTGAAATTPTGCQGPQWPRTLRGEQPSGAGDTSGAGTVAIDDGVEPDVKPRSSTTSTASCLSPSGCSARGVRRRCYGLAGFCGGPATGEPRSVESSTDALDLRGPRPSPTVQVIYVGLALLFGSVSSVSGWRGCGGGGILNALTGESGAPSASFASQVKKYQKLVARNRRA